MPLGHLCFFFLRLDLFIYIFIFNLFYYFWLHWVFVAAHGLSLVAVIGGLLSSGIRASHCGGVSLQSTGSWAHGLQ